MSASPRIERPVVTIIGGGAYSPRLCEALARAIDLPELELRLTARRADRLRIIVDHAAGRVAAIRPRWIVDAAASLDASLPGASIVVLLVRVGGLEARAWDEVFPERYGLVGDEGLGPGGIANAWRSMPELSRIARAIHALAPAARVMNLVAPLGVTTRLLQHHGLDAFGVCELPLLTLESWLARSGAAASECTWRYAGLNHVGWFWNLRSGDRDLLRALAGSPMVTGGRDAIDRATFERYDAAPLRYFYEVFDTAAARRLGLRRSAGRAEELRALSELLLRRYSATPGADVPESDVRATPWLDRAVAPIAAALLGGPPYFGFANVRNGDTIPELPSELVVEVAASFTARGISPCAPGPLPREVAHFLGGVGHAEALTYWAAHRRDPALVARAIEALPLGIPRDAAHELAQLASRAP